jgi:hypothetical protein
VPLNGRYSEYIKLRIFNTKKQHTRLLVLLIQTGCRPSNFVDEKRRTSQLLCALFTVACQFIKLFRYNMAGRVIAQLIISGTTILSKDFFSANGVKMSF